MAGKTYSFSTTAAGAPLTASVEVAPREGAVTPAQERFGRALLGRFMDITADHVTQPAPATEAPAPAAPEIPDDPAAAVEVLAAAAEAISGEPGLTASYHVFRRAESRAGDFDVAAARTVLRELPADPHAVAVQGEAHGARVTCTFIAHEPGVLHALARAAEQATGALHPVRFYADLARARRCIEQARYDDLLHTTARLAAHGPEYEMAADLAALALGLHEEGRGDEAARVAADVASWLPRDLAASAPVRGFAELGETWQEVAVDGLNALPGRRFVAVVATVATGTAETPKDLGAAITAEALTKLRPGTQLYRLNI